MDTNKSKMQKKFIKREEWEKYIMSEDNITFMDSSPVSEISLPPKTIITAIHGNMMNYEAQGIQGTVYVFRCDSNDTVLLNIDEYSFYAKLNQEKSEIRGPLKTEYHHLDDIPSFLKPQAPEWVTEKIENLKHKLNKF